MLKEFKEFISKGNLIDFAVGVVMGAAFTKVTDSLMTNLVNPIVGKLTGADLNNMFITLVEPEGVAKAKTVAAINEAGGVALGYGGFISTLLSFVITAFVMFMVVKAYNKLKAPVAVEVAADPADVVLLREIRDALKK